MLLYVSVAQKYAKSAESTAPVRLGLCRYLCTIQAQYMDLASKLLAAWISTVEPVTSHNRKVN